MIFSCISDFYKAMNHQDQTIFSDIKSKFNLGGKTGLFLRVQDGAMSFVLKIFCPKNHLSLHIICPTHYLSYTSIVLQRGNNIICPTLHFSHTVIVLYVHINCPKERNIICPKFNCTLFVLQRGNNMIRPTNDNIFCSIVLFKKLNLISFNMINNMLSSNLILGQNQGFQQNAKIFVRILQTFSRNFAFFRENK